MSKKNQCGAYRLFKLSKGIGNTFSHEFKKLERDLHIVNHEYAEFINKNSVINGSLYEYDEKASDLYWAKKPFKNVQEKSEDINLGTEGIVTRKTIEEVDVEIKEANKEIAEKDIEHLRLVYNDLTEKQANKTWGIKKLTEEIEKLNK